MKKQLFFIFCLLLCPLLVFADEDPIGGKVVYKDNNVVFHQLDEHTWIGTGNLMFNESLYLLEGENKAILIDAGTKIPGLKKIVESITDKPVTLVATHVHPDHTGSAINEFPELYINAADTVNIARCMPNYTCKLRFLQDGEIIELGNRPIEKMAAKMEQDGLKQLYPGHFYGMNAETIQRVRDLITLSRDVLSGKVKGEPNPEQKLDLDLIVSDYGVRINYNSKRIK